MRGPRSVSSSPGRELRDSFGDISIVRMVDAGRACGAAPLAKPTRLYVGRSTTLHIPFGALLSATSGAELPVRTLVANRTTERIASWDPIDSKHRR